MSVQATDAVVQRSIDEQERLEVLAKRMGLSVDSPDVILARVQQLASTFQINVRPDRMAWTCTFGEDRFGSYMLIPGATLRRLLLHAHATLTELVEQRSHDG